MTNLKFKDDGERIYDFLLNYTILIECPYCMKCAKGLRKSDGKLDRRQSITRLPLLRGTGSKTQQMIKLIVNYTDLHIYQIFRQGGRTHMKQTHLNKKLILGITLGIIAAVTIWWYYSSSIKHPYPITLDDVAKVELHGAKPENKDREATSEEAKQIVNWYNSMSSFKANSSLAGTTPNAGIVIILKSGKSIGITGLGQEGRTLEFQAQGMKFPYFATQDDLRNLIGKIGGP